MTILSFLNIFWCAPFGYQYMYFLSLEYDNFSHVENEWSLKNHQMESSLKVSRCLKVFYAWQVIMFQQEKKSYEKMIWFAWKHNSNSEAN